MDPKVHFILNWGSEGFWASQVIASRTENVEVVVKQCGTVLLRAVRALPHHYWLMRQLPDRNLNLILLKP